MATTARGIVYPTTSTVLTPLSNHFANLASSADTAIGNAVAGGAAFRGLDAAKGAAGQEGRTYYSTDTNRLWFDNGSNWVLNDTGSYLITPTSVTGGTVTDGKTVVTSGSTVTINGVFSTRFRNYRIIMDADLSGVGAFSFLLTAAGTPSVTGYYVQYMFASGTGVAAAYAPNGASLALQTYSGVGHLHEFDLSRVGHPLTTYFQTRDVVPTAGAFSTSGYHSVATAYDGFRISTTAGTFSSANIAVYGMG